VELHIIEGLDPTQQLEITTEALNKAKAREEATQLRAAEALAARLGLSLDEAKGLLVLEER
jgi:hypothetical protein